MGKKTKSGKLAIKTTPKKTAQKTNKIQPNKAFTKKLKTKAFKKAKVASKPLPKTKQITKASSLKAPKAPKK